MKIALAQINTVVGDVRGNLDLVVNALREGHAAGADLVILPEMCLSGYPPQDLVERARFVKENANALDDLASVSSRYPGTGVIAGLPVPSTNDGGKSVHNAAVLVADGGVIHVQHKVLLPTYDVFDEARYFEPGDAMTPVAFKDEVLGISICEDAWNDPDLFQHRLYKMDPIARLAEKGATMIVNISASPFVAGKEGFRLDLVRSHARRHKLPFVFVNQVGGNDELVFDGRSMYVDRDGNVRAVLGMFEEDFAVVDTRSAGPIVDYRPLPEIETVRDALLLGIRDYLHKCGFSKAVVGLSGGIDSAVTLALAAKAIGAENVRAVTMPSPFSSKGSVDDSRALCKNLGVELDEIAIGEVMSAYENALARPFAGRDRDVTEENIQARIRGNVLMAYSNKLGNLVLSTGNKSELAVGYCTLYGDMSGGLAVISDVPKTMVYELAHLLNRDGEVVPRAIVDKVPSAELRPDQKDTDSLPPYETLDAILDLYVEEGLSSEDITSRGFERETVEWVAATVRRNEYKRKQAAPGLKVTSKAFGAGRRFPVAARYDA